MQDTLKEKRIQKFKSRQRKLSQVAKKAVETHIKRMKKEAEEKEKKRLEEMRTGRPAPQPGPKVKAGFHHPTIKPGKENV